jgi:hypothetical protein
MTQLKRIVTFGLSGTRSVGLCNVCNFVGPLLTACSADECVRCMYTPGEQQVRRNGLDVKKHGKARRKKGKIARLGCSVQFFECSSLAGNRDSETRGGGRIRDRWMEKTVSGRPMTLHNAGRGEISHSQALLLSYIARH